MATADQLIDFISIDTSNPPDDGKKEIVPPVNVGDDPKEDTEGKDKPTNTEKKTGKDKRLYGEPGDVNIEGNKETRIGEDGRGDLERHNTDHGSPKKHSNPHDHDITWDAAGNPKFSAPKNYMNGNIPAIK